MPDSDYENREPRTFDPSMLPPRPRLDDLGLSGWTTGLVPPAGVAYLLANFVTWLSHPRMGVSVVCDEVAGGWDLRVRLNARAEGSDVTVIAGR